MTLLFAASAGDKWESKVDEEGRNVQQLKIQAPSMTEEDQYGYTMPGQYRCDSCKVVVHHINDALKRKQPKNRRLQEWEYHDLFDETCAKGFSGYGVAFVNGQNVLSGPGLKRDNLEPGMGAIQMGGETWEKRLGELCRKFVYEKIGEDDVYEHFRTDGEVSEDLCYRETRDCMLGPQPSRDDKDSNKETKPKKPKKAKAAAAARALDIDMSTFMTQLAKKHGLAKNAYTKKRSSAEWEHLILQVSNRIAAQTSRPASQAVEV